MTSRILRYIRIAIAVTVLALVTAYFMDFSSTIPDTHIKDIQFIPVILHGMWIATAVIIVMTWILGRIYCSTLCPFGILMDVVSYMSGKGKKKNFKEKNKRYFPSRPHNVLRYSLFALCVISYFVSSMFMVISALDPYSNFGRIAQNVFAPVYYSLNNAVTWFCGEAGINGPYMVSYDAFSWAGSVFALTVAIVAGVMAYTRGRLWCNTICPVGAGLSILSRFSLFKIKLDAEKCTSCGVCSSACKSGCIDHKNRSVDNSRCVTCFDCLGRCAKDGIKYSFSLPSIGKKPSHPSPSSATDEPSKMSRREFLATSAVIALSSAAIHASSVNEERVCALVNDCVRGKDCDFNRPCFVAGKRLPVAPPGSLGIKEFNASCTACHACIAKCPSKALVPSVTQYGMIGFLQPVMRYDDGHFCAYDCNVCSQVCPTGAIRPITVEQKHGIQIGIAHLSPKKCVAIAKDYDCGACAEHCPVGAVHMVANAKGIPVPEIIPEVCVGCGACEQICPEKAIVVYGHETHRKAVLPEKEEARVINLDGFGF